VDIVSKTKSAPPSNSGTGDFFAIDRRAWAHVCRLGMNAAIAYLVIARGTGGDNRTSKWSTNSIEQRTGISRARGAVAIAALEQSGAVIRDPSSKRDRPKFRITPAHELPGCEGFPPPALNTKQQRVFDQLGNDWAVVPKDIMPKQREEVDRWGIWEPRKIADELVVLGRATRTQDGMRYRAVAYDAETAAKPDWIWLPNALVDGAADEIHPVELIRQTNSAPTLQLFVDLYGTHSLDEDGGVHFRCIRQKYKQHKIGERGPYVVWGFVPDILGTWANVRFVAPHLAGAGDDKDKLALAWEEFWACWTRLCDLRLVEIVAHLVHADTSEGEIIHPMALGETGLEVEREVFRAAHRTAVTMITKGQYEWALKQGVVALAPVPRHIGGVRMLGVARLRYRPRTNRTRAFFARETEWREVIARLDEIARSGEADCLATSRGIKVD
jgi:hypothetical protein